MVDRSAATLFCLDIFGSSSTEVQAKASAALEDEELKSLTQNVLTRRSRPWILWVLQISSYQRSYQRGLDEKKPEVYNSKRSTTDLCIVSLRMWRDTGSTLRTGLRTRKRPLRSTRNSRNSMPPLARRWLTTNL